MRSLNKKNKPALLITKAGLINMVVSQLINNRDTFVKIQGLLLS
jgi:hypothetical protein